MFSETLFAQQATSVVGWHGSIVNHKNIGRRLQNTLHRRLAGLYVLDAIISLIERRAQQPRFSIAKTKQHNAVHARTLDTPDGCAVGHFTVAKSRQHAIAKPYANRAQRTMFHAGREQRCWKRASTV